MRLAALLPIGFAFSAAACALLLRHTPPEYGVDVAQPLIVATYWQHFGALIFGAVACGIAIASVGYGAVLLRREPLAPHSVVTICALACAAALAVPVIFSSDVYAYAGYGAMALHGINPYAHARVTIRDPLFDAVLWQWGNPPPMCVYGPAFVWFAKALVALLLPVGTAAPLWGFRLASCLALIACAPLARIAFASLGERRARLAAAGIALNPVAIWSCAEGHNDALVLAAILTGFALAARSRVFFGAFAVALAALIKAPALAAAFGLVVSVWHNGALRMRAAAGAALGAALAIGIAAPLEFGVRAHLAPAGHYFPQFSLQALSLPLTLLSCVLLAALGVRDLASRRLQGWAYLAFAGWLAIPNPYPWYGLWLLPVAFLAEDARVRAALLAASLLIFARFYGDATTDLSPQLTAAIVAIEFAVPLLLLLTGARTAIRHRGRPESRTSAPGSVMPRSS